MMYVVKTKTENKSVSTLAVQAGVRYWEDADVDGEQDELGDFIPCRDGDYWCPIIELETGLITNWETGKTASIHYKVCDDGVYRLLDENGNTVVKKEGYVPDIMSPSGEGFGEYIIMNVDSSGKIQDWGVNLSCFNER